VISYGESKPVSPNKTRTGRAENRRIVVRVLS
jgi:flagellar motor protein MotB